MAVKQRFFYDTEFIENGQTVGLLSIGIVTEDGREYYAVLDDGGTIDRAMQHPWLRENVLPHLPIRIGEAAEALGCPDWCWDSGHTDYVHVKPRSQVAAEVSAFIRGQGSANRRENELWAYFGAYDHVALCQLWGRMIDLPPFVPMFTNDLMTVVSQLEAADVEIIRPDNGGEHNALADARWNHALFQELLRAGTENAVRLSDRFLTEVGNVSIPRDWLRKLYGQVRKDRQPGGLQLVGLNDEQLELLGSILAS